MGTARTKRVAARSAVLVGMLGSLCLATALEAVGQSPFSTITKSGTDPATSSTAVSGGPAGTTAAGNTIDWVVDYRNTSGSSANVNITDPITGNQSFVPGSLETPPGLSPRWSTDGGTLYVNTEPGSGVNGVGATGTSVPGSTGAQAQASPPPPAAVPAAGAGDGFEALFVGNNVYNVFHHRGGLSGATPITVLDCHVRTTGAQCPGYPTYVSPTAGAAFGTGSSTLTTGTFAQAAVSGNKIYYPVGVIGTRNDGVVCANVATQTSCGFFQLGSYTGGGTNSNNNSATINGGAVMGSHYYTVSYDGEIYCFDMATETPCQGYAPTVSDPTAPALRGWPYYNLQAWDDRYLFGAITRPAIGATPAQRDLICIDVTTNVSCPGFPQHGYVQSPVGGFHNATLVPILDASANVTGVCGVATTTGTDHPFKCFDLNGNAVATPFSETQTAGTVVNAYSFGSVGVVGSRIYFAETTQSNGRATYTCWDYSVTPSAPGKIGNVCPGFVAASTNQAIRAYTIRQDPQNPECLWQLGDANRFEVFSATFGGTSCNLGNAVVELTPEDFYCDGASGHVDGWDAITLGGITTADYNAVAVTITDENGDPVPGWQNKIVTNASQTIDISSIPYSGTTTSLRISVAISWGTHPVKPVTVRSTFDGDPPQVCFQTTVGDAECATAQDITNEANAITDAGTAGSDAPDGHDSGVVTFTQPADSSVCRTDLSVQKTGDALVDPGGAVSWTLTVTNHGPDDSTGSTVTDTIPDGFTNVAAPGCDVTGNQVTCDVGPLGLNDTQNFTITANAPDDSSTCFDNDASVESAETDPDDNNADSVRTCTTPVADLELTKTGPAVVSPNGQVSWMLTVTNNGPDPSSGSTLTDTVPGDVTNVASPDCDVTGNEVSCDVGPLGLNESESFEVTGTAPSTTSTCFDNVALVEGAEGDPVDANDEDTARTCTPAAADLELTKSAPATVDPEGQITWTLTVHNNGPNPSTGSTVTDELPAQITNVSAPGCDVSGQTITCEVGPLAVNGETEITVTGDAPETPSFCFSNAASVVGDEGDPVTENDDASARTCTTPAADLEIAKTATPVVDPEGEVTWNLTVTNNGPDASTGATVTDHLPGGITNISAPDCDVVSHTITCEVDPLAVDGTQTFTVTGDAPDLPSFCFENQASVAGFEGDPVGANNQAGARTCTTPSADLQLEKSAPATVERGGEVTWTLTVTNLGPNDSSGSTVTDTLPATITNVASSDCEVDGNTVTCDVEELEPDDTASFTVTGTAPSTSATCFDNDGSVAGIEGDPVLANNIDSVQTCTAPAADLELAKSAPATVDPSGQVTWTLTVTNQGPDPSPGATVTDTLPDEITNVATETPGCTLDANALECALGPMEADATAEITITGDAPDSFSTCFSNAASVIGTEDDLELANNDDSVETCTGPPPPSPSGKPKLSIKKRASTDSARPGEVVSYRIIVRNKGKADARQVRVCDKLPAGQKLLSAPGSDSHSSKRVCWKLKRLKAGAKRTFKVVTQIAFNAGFGSQTNKAIVKSANGRRSSDREEVGVEPVGGACPSFRLGHARC